MRFLISGAAVVSAILYGGAAFYFYVQENWARSLSAEPSITLPSLTHPEATLAIVRKALEDDDYSARVVPAMRQSLMQAPSFYQSSFFVGAYYSNRLEEPEHARRAFEAALKRYPANGRLHLAYGQHLLAARSEPSAHLPLGTAVRPFATGVGPRRTHEKGPQRPIQEGTAPKEPLDAAESHISAALRLEPELTEAAVDLLRREGVPSERWERIIPRTFPARRMLLAALAAEGDKAGGLAQLRSMFPDARDPGFLEEAANYALAWGDPELALEVARRWQQEETSGRTGAPRSFSPDLFLAKTYLELGDLASAERTFRAAIEAIERRSGPSSREEREIMCAMGYAHLNRGHDSYALSLFAEAVTVAPSDAPAHLGLARTYARMEERELATEEYRRVLKLDPDNHDAESELSRLILANALGGKEP